MNFYEQIKQEQNCARDRGAQQIDSFRREESFEQQADKARR